MAEDGADRYDTHVPLRHYIERILDEREAALKIAFKGQQDALQLAREGLERELNHLNALRQEVTADRSTFVLRESYSQDMRALRDWQSRMDGALSLIRWLGVAGVIALVLEISRLAGVR